MKVLLIDPTGIAYGFELAKSLSKYTELAFITRKNDVTIGDICCNKFFWFRASRWPRLIDKAIKGTSYITAYAKILRYVKHEKIDVVHIQWLSLPKVDDFFLKKLKSTGTKLVFTAHNVLPHRRGDSFVNIYKNYYSIFDKIIVHGESVKQEFLKVFPEYGEKLIIEHHGVFDSLSVDVDEGTLDAATLIKVKAAKKVGIFFGNMFYNKGTDVLVSHWLKYYKNNPDYFLFVVGKLDSGYLEMIDLEAKIRKCCNIFYKPQIIEETELNTYISMSDFVIMPYRHASMSGILFKAAMMNKTVLTTNAGSIKEYINDECAFCVDSFEVFFNLLDFIIRDTDRIELLLKGKKLGDHIRKEYSWDSIAKSTVEDVYETHE